MKEKSENKLNLIKRYSFISKISAIIKRTGSAKKTFNILKSKLNIKFRMTCGLNFYPTQISIEPTTICNYACPACYHGLTDLEGSPGGTRPKYIDFKSFKNLIDEISDYTWYLNLVGEGESFLHPQIYEMINYASSKGIFVSSESNASHLNIESLAKCGLGSIHFALDGFSQDVYQKYRVKGDFNKVLNNITEFCEYANKHNTNTKILVRYLVNSYTEPQIEEARKYFLKYPFVNFYLDYFFMPPASAKTFREFQDATTKAIYDEWTPKKLKEFDVYSFDAKSGYYRLKSLLNPISGKCISPYVGAILDAGGNLYPCCISAPHEPNQLCYGNVFEEGFMPVWKGSKATAFRKAYKLNKGNCTFCKECSENH